MLKASDVEPCTGVGNECDNCKTIFNPTQDKAACKCKFRATGAAAGSDIADQLKLTLAVQEDKKRVSFKICHDGEIDAVVRSLHWSDDKGKIKKLKSISDDTGVAFSLDEPTAELPFVPDFGSVLSVSSVGDDGLDNEDECVKVKLKTKKVAGTLDAIYNGALEVGVFVEGIEHAPHGASFVSDCESPEVILGGDADSIVEAASISTQSTTSAALVAVAAMVLLVLVIVAVVITRRRATPKKEIVIEKTSAKEFTIAL